jgi:hypothetical protein
VGAASPARADPTFAFRNPPGSPEIVWNTTAQVGLSAATGNTSSLGLTGKARVARTAPRWRASSTAELALARSRVDFAVEQNGVPGIGPGELRSVQQTTRQAWSLLARIDRFLSERNGAYVAGSVGADRPAGKSLLGHGQFGWARELVRSTHHQVRLELGYDLAYEELVLTDARALQFARGFLGYAAKLEQRLAFDLSSEVLANLGSEARITGHVSPFSATRLVQQGALSYALNGSISLALRGTARFDAEPSPRPPPPDTGFEAGYAPLAERWDTTTDVLAIVTF